MSLDRLGSTETPSFLAERRRVAALTALHEIGLDLSSQASLTDLQGKILAGAMRLVEAPAGALYLVEEAGSLVCAVSAGYRRPVAGVRVRLGEGMVGHIAQVGEPLVTGDYATWPHRVATFPGEVVKSVMGLPLHWRERLLGVLVLSHPDGNRFAPADLELAALFAGQAAVLISNAQLVADAQAKALELGQLYAAAQEMAASRDPQVVLDVLARHLAESLQVSSASILVADADIETVTVVAEHWAQAATAAERAPSAGRAYRLADYPLTARAVLGQQVVIAHYDDPDLARSEQVLFAEFEGRTELLIPIVTRGRALGEARLWENRRRTFAPAEIRLAETLARQAADVIENARLFAALEDEKRRLELLYTLSQRLTASLDLGEVSRRALDLVCDALRADRAELYLLAANTDLMQLAAAAGSDAASDAAPLDLTAESPGSTLARRVAAVRDVVLAPAMFHETPTWIRSAVGVPLFIGDGLIGVYVLLSRRPEFFNEGHWSILQGIAAPIALALQNAQLFEAEARRAHHLEALNEITRAAVSDLDYHTLLDTLADRLAYMFSADACFLTRWDAARRSAATAAASADIRANPGPLPAAPGGPGLTEAVLAGGRALPIEDTHKPNPIEGESLGAARAILALPLVAGERRLGAALVVFHQPHPFALPEVARGEQAARQMAVAIAKAELFDETRRRAEELATLVDLSAALRVAATGQDMLPIFLRKACEVTGGVKGSIFLVEPESGDLVLRASHPALDPLPEVRHRPGEGITGHVVLTGEPYFTADILADPLADLHNPTEGAYLQSIRSALAVPLRTHEGVSGVMHVGREQSAHFSPNEVHLMTAIADVAGNALQRANLLETLEQRVEARTHELAQANDRLKELDRLKDQFISNVSHELRTPLTNIKLHLSLLERRGPEVLARYLPTLQRETERLRRLIEDLLDLSRLQSQIAAPQRERLGADGLLAEVLALHITRADARGLSVQHHASQEPADIYADRAQMIQVFTNLLGNAVAYTPSGGTVRLSTRRAGRDGVAGVEVTVHNTGSVIPPSDLPHLFQRFFRGRTGIDSGEAGTGLGLAICKEIVEQHQGAISVESTAETGTSFQVWLPAPTARA